MTDVVAAVFRESPPIYLEIVVLRGNGDDSGRLLTHWVVASMVPKRQPAGARTSGQPKDLVSEADAQQRYRLALLDQRAGEVDKLGYTLGVARTIGEHDTVR